MVVEKAFTSGCCVAGSARRGCSVRAQGSRHTNIGHRAEGGVCQDLGLRVHGTRHRAQGSGPRAQGGPGWREQGSYTGSMKWHAARSATLTREPEVGGEIKEIEGVHGRLEGIMTGCAIGWGRS